jgi:uracil-DNA glycosylase family 4
MTDGFFSDDDIKITRGDETIINKKSQKVANCDTCGLQHSCKSPKMEYSGKGEKKILIIGEAPGQTEDEKGTQFIVASGKLLRSILNEIDLDLDRDFWKTNAICCRPLKNDTPKPMQILACRKQLLKTIHDLQPKVIIPLGKVAMDKMNGRNSGSSMTDWQGAAIPDQEYEAWICPTWHPSFLLRNEGENSDPVIKMQLIRSIKNAIKLSTQFFYTAKYESDCFILKNKEEAIDIIK